MSNNAAERAMRSLVLGRTNHLFAGSDAGGQPDACIYTIVETAKMNGANPQPLPGRHTRAHRRTPQAPNQRPAALELDTIAQHDTAPNIQNRGLQPTLTVIASFAPCDPALQPGT